MKETGPTTSAKKHNEMRTQDSSQRGPTLYVGPHYKQLKHLGTVGVVIGIRVCSSRLNNLLHPTVVWNARLLLFLYDLPEYIYLYAGRGGTGDTWAFLDKRSGEEVAIKFLKRPLPKVLLENIKREFAVRHLVADMVVVLVPYVLLILLYHHLIHCNSCVIVCVCRFKLIWDSGMKM